MHRDSAAAHRRLFVGTVVVLVVLAPSSLLQAATCRNPIGQGAGNADLLGEARLHIRQGLLTEALRGLSGIPQDAPAGVRASAALLAGNVCFERGDFAAAETAYRRAEALFLEANVTKDEAVAGLVAARANLELSQEKLIRASMLARAAGWLRAITIAVIGLTMACIVGLSNRLTRLPL